MVTNKNKTRSTPPRPKNDGATKMCTSPPRYNKQDPSDDKGTEGSSPKTPRIRDYVTDDPSSADLYIAALGEWTTVKNKRRKDKMVACNKKAPPGSLESAVSKINVVTDEETERAKSVNLNETLDILANIAICEQMLKDSILFGSMDGPGPSLHIDRMNKSHNDIRALSSFAEPVETSQDDSSVPKNDPQDNVADPDSPSKTRPLRNFQER